MLTQILLLSFLSSGSALRVAEQSAGFSAEGANSQALQKQVEDTRQLVRETFTGAIHDMVALSKQGLSQVEFLKELHKKSRSKAWPTDQKSLEILGDQILSLLDNLPDLILTWEFDLQLVAQEALEHELSTGSSSAGTNAAILDYTGHFLVCFLTAIDDNFSVLTGEHTMIHVHHNLLSLLASYARCLAALGAGYSAAASAATNSYDEESSGGMSYPGSNYGGYYYGYSMGP